MLETKCQPTLIEGIISINLLRKVLSLYSYDAEGFKDV